MLPSQPLRVLLIEDDAALRLGLARQFEADGYRVDHAADGLFQAQKYPVDLVIVDLGLPKLSGIDVVRRLRGEGRTAASGLRRAEVWRPQRTGKPGGSCYE